MLRIAAEVPQGTKRCPPYSVSGDSERGVSLAKGRAESDEISIGVDA